MKSGTVKLIYKGKVNNQAMYNDEYSRNKIIEGWRKLYKARFEQCAIQIRPEIKEKPQ